MASIRKRKKHNGEMIYTVQVRLKGFPNAVASFKRLTDAKKWAQSTVASMRENRYFQTAEAQKHTVSEMIERYIEWRVLKRKKLNDVKPILEWWDKQIGSYTLANVSRSMLSLQIEALSRKTVKRFDRSLGISKHVPISPARINRYTAIKRY